MPKQFGRRSHADLMRAQERAYIAELVAKLNNVTRQINRLTKPSEHRATLIRRAMIIRNALADVGFAAEAA